MTKTTKKSLAAPLLSNSFCWIITEGMAGTENQCIAVAKRMGLPYEIKRISLYFPYKYLCPYILKTAPKWAIKGIDFSQTLPNLIIASGRKAVPVALALKKRANACTVFIQDPKIDSDYFDLVAIPAHDNVSGNNVVVTTAAPNMITPDSLKAARQAHDYAALPQKKIAVLIGGNSKTHTMPDDFADQLEKQLKPFLSDTSYGFMVTVSRRTPASQYHKLQSVFSSDRCVFWSGEGENPYQAFLAWADVILVTEDSTSMLSDACSTDKKVYRLPLRGGSKKFDRLYDILQKERSVEPFKGHLETGTFKPLNDAQRVADAIASHLQG